jgi:hypothetical protein
MLASIGAMCSAFAQTTTTTAGTRDFNLSSVGLGATETAEINVGNIKAPESNVTEAYYTSTI